MNVKQHNIEFGDINKNILFEICNFCFFFFYEKIYNKNTEKIQSPSLDT